MEKKWKKNVCTERKNVISINLSKCTHICRYYKYPTRKYYDNKTLAPKGMCIDLFHSAYPVCLSLLYGVNYKDKVLISCPSPVANVYIEITKKATKTIYLRRFVAWILSKFYKHKIEIPDTEIIMTVKNNTDSNCVYSYKKGQKFKFNLWLGREVCPATFDALYPSIHNLMRDKCIPWDSSSNNKIVCPDPKGNITMSIIKKGDIYQED